MTAKEYLRQAYRTEPCEWCEEYDLIAQTVIDRLSGKND
jgi:hypothetical protein